MLSMIASLCVWRLPLPPPSFLSRERQPPPSPASPIPSGDVRHIVTGEVLVIHDLGIEKGRSDYFTDYNSILPLIPCSKRWVSLWPPRLFSSSSFSSGFLNDLLRLLIIPLIRVITSQPFYFFDFLLFFVFPQFLTFWWADFHGGDIGLF